MAMVRRQGKRGFVWLFTAVVGAALTTFIGCGPGGYSGPTGTVTGKVTLDGEPVPQGCAVSFVSPAGFTASAKVGAGGSYTLLNVDKPEIPVASYKVAVAQLAAEVSGADYDKYMSAGGGGEAKSAPEAIPAKYQTAETSGLSFDVKQGPNTFNIELKK
jgi:hypothetical protein